jgi:hypothetical protein
VRKKRKSVLGWRNTLSLTFWNDIGFLLLSASLIWVTNASSPFLPSITGLPLTPICLPSFNAFFARVIADIDTRVNVEACPISKPSSCMSLMACSVLESPLYSLERNIRSVTCMLFSCCSFGLLQSFGFWCVALFFVHTLHAPMSLFFRFRFEFERFRKFSTNFFGLAYFIVFLFLL